MDFYRIMERSTKAGVTEVYPDFVVGRSKDLMVRAKSFYAVWDQEKGLWSTDEYDVQRLVDSDLMKYECKSDGHVQRKLMGSFSSNSWLQFRNYMAHISDSSHQLDEKITFLNTEVKKTDYVSKRLPYPLESGDISAYDELVGTLYDPLERSKLEWAIGAVISGDARKIQKFIVLYGAAGAGKSTYLSIVQRLFAGYYTTFEAKALTGSSNAFSTEVFRNNPLVAIQHDGDLSKIEDNTKLNSIISHEEMTMNEKYKPSYTSKINAFLFMGTNKPVKITDAKSGIIRRLIDVRPSGRKLPPRRYHALMEQINFELGAIAAHCLEVYREMGENYYNAYRPVDMMLKTDVFYNFVEAHMDQFMEHDGVTLQAAYSLYKKYCEETLVEFKLAQYKFREELKNYFDDFQERVMIDGERVRNYYTGFNFKKFGVEFKNDDKVFSLVMDETTSLFDEALAEFPAQYANAHETPSKAWATVKTVLSDLDTKKLHYVKPPQNHIVIDFDLKDEDGKKSAEKNLEAASNWPPTYSEWSKGGGGIHLHYNYDGDTSELASVYSEGIEIKVFTGDASLRRRLSTCNNIPIATINSGLPFKEKKPVLNTDIVITERTIRKQIIQNLQKQIHPGTKPSVDFIKKILDEAYESGTHYDVSDLRQKILVFAANSTNQAEACLKAVAEMKFSSEENSPDTTAKVQSSELVFFDCEVFPNLFIVSWKQRGKDKKVVRMVNPTPVEIENLIKMNLVGFNCRLYDNHILYARMMGYSNYQLYQLSQRIIKSEVRGDGKFSEAYSLSYADIYEFSSVKKSLKVFEIDLGLIHKELGLPWDSEVPEEKWQLVGEYCDNDVIATEAVFEDRAEDFVARQILADLSGLAINDTTQQHAAKIIFEGDKKASEKFVYTDLSELFPGYAYSYGKSTYRDEDPSEGGYVYAEPGIYPDVAVLDVASMHPTSIEKLNLFGPYTRNYVDIKNARVAIKRKQYDVAREMLGGVLKPYLKSESSAKNLSYALKIVINIVYGMTSAKFDNPFRDKRNVDNIVAKRGALFMIDLKHAVQEKGFTVAHIKTDSIKIPNATPEIIKFIEEFGDKYGYQFEHETTYEKFCLVNDAVYIAKDKDHWEAVGAQFQHPYVFKKLFSHEPIEFSDLIEKKSVTTALYLDMNEDKGEDEHDYVFVGRTGAFVPVLPGSGGGVLCREKDGKYYAATGTKGFRWLEATVVTDTGREGAIDESYFKKLCDSAVGAVSKYGSFDAFSSSDGAVHA